MSNDNDPRADLEKCRAVLRSRKRCADNDHEEQAYDLLLAVLDWCEKNIALWSAETIICLIAHGADGKSGLLEGGK